MLEEIAFMPDRADRAQAFFERVLVHTKGRFAREPFILADWQRDDIIRPLFGTVRYELQVDDWVRNYTTAWIELGRGNGKSEMLAGIALYLLLADGEEQAEVYGAAVDREQASLVFDVAKRMVNLSPFLSKRLKVIDSRKTITDHQTGSFYRVLGGMDSLGNLGQAPHGVIFDEIVAQKGRELYDALRTGMGKRTQPLLVMATTAGMDLSSFAKQEHDFSERVVSQPELDPRRLVYLRNTPRDADPFDPDTWKIANPALGDFLLESTIADEAHQAQSDPLKEHAFRVFRLNQWQQSTTRYIPLWIWDASDRPLRRDLIGKECYGGLDLAATTDLASLCWVFPDGDELDALWRTWTPEAMLPKLDRMTGGQASTWVREGWIELCEGEVISYDLIHQRIEEDAENYDVRELAVDRWNAAATFQHLDSIGLPAAAVPQGYGLSGAIHELSRLAKSRKIRHGGNPVARWNIDAVEVKVDPAERLRIVKPQRGTAQTRIDCASALVMALDRWQALTEAEPAFDFIAL